MNDERFLFEPVAYDRANLSAFADANERARDLERATFESEREHFDTRIRIAVGMPLALARLEVNRQSRPIERTCCHPVVVDGDRFDF
jgi:hypothetical protein